MKIDLGIFGKVLKVVKIVVISILLLFITVVLLQRFSDNKISFFNHRIFAVITGSMAPKYNVGDVLVSKYVKPENINPGDTISYLGMRGSLEGRVITHDVTKKMLDKDGKYVFRAKGLANMTEDPLITEDQIFGVVVYKCKTISFIYKIVTKPIGFFLLIVIPLFFIIGSRILMFLLAKEEKRREI